MRTHKIGTLFVLMIHLLMMGCTSQDPQNKLPRNYTVIITNPESTKTFLEFEGIAYDTIWIPNKKQIEDLHNSLVNYLNVTHDIPAKTWVSREYIINHLSDYCLEYSGFIYNDTQYIICNMLFFKPSELIGNNQFTTVFDGGCGIVRVIFEAQSKKIVSIDCNGEA